MGYGVIGSPADSGSVSLGSSPGTPAQDKAVRKRKRKRKPKAIVFEKKLKAVGDQL
jgi:hypothetical protein